MSEISWSVKLALFSEKTAPEELTRLAGVEPDFSARAGDSWGPADLPRRFNHWELRSRLPLQEELERHVDDVLRRVKDVDCFRKAGAAGGGFELSIVGRLTFEDDDSPALNLTEKQVNLLAAVGASIDAEFIYAK